MLFPPSLQMRRSGMNFHVTTSSISSLERRWIVNGPYAGEIVGIRITAQIDMLGCYAVVSNAIALVFAA